MTYNVFGGTLNLYSTYRGRWNLVYKKWSCTSLVMLRGWTTCVLRSFVVVLMGRIDEGDQDDCIELSTSEIGHNCWYVFELFRTGDSWEQNWDDVQRTRGIFIAAVRSEEWKEGAEGGRMDTPIFETWLCPCNRTPLSTQSLCHTISPRVGIRVWSPKFFNSGVGVPQKNKDCIPGCHDAIVPLVPLL